MPRDRLVVITGLSGSGKSSLAFDTIYAEGQRRYVESLSAYARQFLGEMQKPDVDQIDGLCPAISIDQKGASRNPRSTVGTVTEIYDHLRLLFARIGHPHCPTCGREIERQTRPADRRPDLRPAGGDAAAGPRPGHQGPQDRGRPGLRRRSAARASPASGSTASRWTWRRRGSSTSTSATRSRSSWTASSCATPRSRTARRRRADGRPATPTPEPVRPPDSTRLADSVETALRLGEGVVLIAPAPAGRRGAGVRGAPLQRALQLPVRRHHGGRARAAQLQLQLAARRLPEPAPASAAAWRSIPTASSRTRTSSLADGALVPWARMPMENSWHAKIIEAVCREHGWDYAAPVKDLPPEALDYILYSGRGERVVIGYRHERGENTYGATFEGIIPNLERRFRETESEFIKSELGALHGRPAVPHLRGQAAQAGDPGGHGRRPEHLARLHAVDHGRLRVGRRPAGPADRARDGRSPGRSSRRSRPGWASCSTSASTT